MKKLCPYRETYYVHGVNDVRQTDLHTAETIVFEPGTFGIEMAIEKLKRHI